MYDSLHLGKGDKDAYAPCPTEFQLRPWNSEGLSKLKTSEELKVKEYTCYKFRPWACAALDQIMNKPRPIDSK